MVCGEIFLILLSNLIEPLTFTMVRFPLPPLSCSSLPLFCFCIQVQDVAVLVMDEAHHANGNHPYATIMAHFVANTPKHMRPRVLGLTATPVQVNPQCICRDKKDSCIW